MENTEEYKRNEKSFAREIIEWIICIFAALIIALLIRYYIFTPTLVKQESMTPTILDGERVIINRLIRTFKIPIHKGDIITFEKPTGTDEEMKVATYNEVKSFKYFLIHDVLEIGKTSFIKRVIGVSGDHIYITQGKVFVNDELQEEKYLPEGLETDRKGEYYDVIVPEGYVYVMGDNRPGSGDSRGFGCVPIEKIEGRVSFRIWPLSVFGTIGEN